MQINLKDNIIGQYRAAVTSFAVAMNEHNRLVKEFLAMGLSLSDSDFKPGSANEGITVAEFNSAFQGLQAVEGLLAANNNAHYGAIFKLKA